MSKKIPLKQAVRELSRAEAGVYMGWRIDELIHRAVVEAVRFCLEDVPGISGHVFAAIPHAWECPRLVGDKYREPLRKDEFVGQWLYDQIMEELGYGNAQA